ncbi:MAG: hypothetical protein ABIV51_07225 [Saprospiraceae bacterium]
MQATDNMLFPHVIGQSHVLADLQQMILQERVPQTLLFSGPSGSGTLATAIDFVAYLFADPSAEPMENDPNFIRIQKLVHPDLHFAFPVVGSDKTSDDFFPLWRKQLHETAYFSNQDWIAQIADDKKQGNINKKECDRILHLMSLKRYEGKRKVMIIWLPEYLGKEGNRLLKILEEPTDDSLFILVTENTSRILPTILSRCQIIQFNPLTDSDISGYLTDKYEIEPEEASNIAYLSDGSLTEALSLKDQEENQPSYAFLEWLRICYKGLGPEMVQWADEFAKLGREQQKNFFTYGLHYLRELLWVLAIPEREPRLRKEEVPSIRNLSRSLNINSLKKLVTLLDTAFLYIERNANPRLLGLSASFEIRDIMKQVNKKS